MKKLLLMTGFALAMGQVSAQTWSYPPQLFSGSTNICDGTPYKLVFFDDFNGTTLSPPWNRFISWAGMTGGDHDNWADARLGGEPRNGIYKDKNVVVSGGAAHLRVFKEKAAWKCDTCATDSFRANYTYGCITLPYKNSANQDIGYDNGKFEASIRFPVFKGFWGVFWLWHRGIDVNELDIAEALGPRGSWPYIDFGGYKHPKVSDNLHAFIDTAHGQPNPFGLPLNAVSGVAYPNQSWWAFLKGTAFKQDEYHTYTSEWDSTCIKTYLDHELVNTVWKYYRERRHRIWLGLFWYTYTVREPSGCLPAGDLWKVTYAFPYHKTSDCQLRFTTAMDKSVPADMTGYVAPVMLGSMDIEYVKIWQRHPEANNHTDICSVSGTITGPDTICNTATYALPSGIPTGGTWSLSNSNLSFTSSGASTRSVAVATRPYSYTTTLNYTFVSPVPGCGIQTISKTVMINKVVRPPVFCTRIARGHTPGIIHLNLQAGSDIPGATYEWMIYYGPNAGSLSYYHAFGKNVNTPEFSSTGIAYYASWTLRVSTSCTGMMFTGTSSRGGYYSMRPLSEIFNQDTSVISVDVRFNTPSDTAAYEQAVYDRVARQFVTDFSDTTTINEMIMKIRFEELAPYVVFGQEQPSPQRPGPGTPTSAEQSATIIYPNPASGELHIQPDAQFIAGEQVSLSVLDMAGRLIRSGARTYNGSPLSLSLTGLPDALYFLEIRQPGRVERHKITKASQ